MRLVILGGSGSATPELAEALGDWPGGVERRPPLEIVLVARSRERLELVAGEVRRRTASLDGAAIDIVAETERRAALDGADAIVNAVRIGGLAARVFDETFPQAHGVPGEETMGPGGLANAMRTIPALRETWEDIAAVAPAALMINLTNPSGAVVTAAEREFGLRSFSVCDSPVVLCDAIAERLGAPIGDVRRRYVGMNHVGWWVPADAAELAATADLVTGQDEAAIVVQGAIGAPYVRYYVHPDRLLQKQAAASETRAQQLQRLEAELLDGYAARDTGLPRRGAAWYGKAVLPLVDAWVNGSDAPIIVGMRNGGRIPGLPDDAMSEGAVEIREPAAVRPLESPPLPPLPAAMLQAHAAFESLAVDAAAPDATPDDLLRALMSNPMVPSFDVAQKLARDIQAGAAA